MSGESRIKGLCIKASPLGESGRLITVLTDEQGIIRLAAPGARRPKSSLAAATPLTYLSFQIFGKEVSSLFVRLKFSKATTDWGKILNVLPRHKQ